MENEVKGKRKVYKLGWVKKGKLFFRRTLGSENIRIVSIDDKKKYDKHTKPLKSDLCCDVPPMRISISKGSYHDFDSIRECKKRSDNKFSVFHINPQSLLYKKESMDMFLD